MFVFLHSNRCLTGHYTIYYVLLCLHSKRCLLELDRLEEGKKHCDTQGLMPGTKH